MTDRPDPDQPRTGAPRREARRPRPDRTRSGAPVRSTGLPGTVDGDSVPVESDAASAAEPDRPVGARHGGDTAPGTGRADRDLTPIGEPLDSGRTGSEGRDPRPETTTEAELEPADDPGAASRPYVGSGRTAAALDALEVLLARYDDAVRATVPTADVDAAVVGSDGTALDDTLSLSGSTPDDDELTTTAASLDDTQLEDTLVDALVDDALVDDATLDDTQLEDTLLDDTTLDDTQLEDAVIAETSSHGVIVEDATADDVTIEDAVSDPTEPADPAAAAADRLSTIQRRFAESARRNGTPDQPPAIDRIAERDELTPSRRVALDREVRNRLGTVASDPERAAAVAATLPPSLPTATRQRTPAPAAPQVTKLTRWDRPAPPRDWRYVVGTAGRVLIVTGLLMFGFVAYQLWGTGIATARAQNQLANRFEELVSERTGSTVPTVTRPPATSVPESPVAPATSAPGDGATEGATPAPTPTLAPGGVVQDLPPIVEGEALARLEIPRMGKTGGDALIVVPGIDPESLQDGPGHYPDTPLPGQLGNAAIAGHRTTWGEPFARIDELQPGDEIIVTMISGDRFVYEVASTEIVEPEDYDVVRTVDPTVAQLTLTSCHPRFSARQRIVVRSFLAADESDPVGLPTFYDIEANTAPSGVDDPTVTAPATSVAGSSTDDATVADDATVPTTAAPLPGDPGSGPDALTAGWFHDSGAWPHIVAWGALVALVALVAYRISKRFRNLAIGWSIMVVPFVVSLYFLYQNVNRLLPPGL